MGGLRVGCCPDSLLWEMLERTSAFKSIIWVKCQPYDTRRASFQGDGRVRVWGDCRLGLKEHVRCHGILEPKASPAQLSANSFFIPDSTRLQHRKEWWEKIKECWSFKAIAGPLVKLSQLRVEVCGLQTKVWRRATGSRSQSWLGDTWDRDPELLTSIPGLCPPLAMKVDIGVDQHSWQTDYLMSQIISP